MEQTWRWFGPDDPVTLDHAKQAGATGIVTALHHQYDGRVWSLDDILAHKRLVEEAGLTWRVCESIPMNNAIKLRQGPYRQYIDAWKDTLANLGRAGISIVCYNFMPLVDWVRTDLFYRLPSTGYAVRFDMVDFVAYDVHVLKRPRAEDDYDPAIVAAARERLDSMGEERLERLEANLIGVLTAREATYTRQTIRDRIADFDGVDADVLRGHLVEFLREVLPVAEEVGVRLAIHPDDPPFSLYGLPRIVSTAEDARRILDAFPTEANGLTLCTGSYGARADNDLPAMAREFGPRIHFAHLRNVKRQEDGSFFEADHLDGDTDMVAVIAALLGEERRRAEAGAPQEIPMRPDHGHLLGDDIDKPLGNAGYSLVGRLKGLAELRGVIRALEWEQRRPH